MRRSRRDREMVTELALAFVLLLFAGSVVVAALRGLWRLAFG